MVPSSSTELTETDGRRLLLLARAAIEQAARDGSEPPAPALPGVFATPSASFVTLTQHGRLRGCMGSLNADLPLDQSVVHNACSAALRDPRFEPLKSAETALTGIDVAVLSPLEPLAVDSMAALEAALRPGVDGLLIDDGTHRATFLPKVWEQLPAAAEFLAHLVHKAGIPAGQWPAAMRCHRYTAQSFSEAAS